MMVLCILIVLDKGCCPYSSKRYSVTPLFKYFCSMLPIWLGTIVPPNCPVLSKKLWFINCAFALYIRRSLALVFFGYGVIRRLERLESKSSRNLGPLMFQTRGFFQGCSFENRCFTGFRVFRSFFHGWLWFIGMSICRWSMVSLMILIG